MTIEIGDRVSISSEGVEYSGLVGKISGKSLYTYEGGYIGSIDEAKVTKKAEVFVRPGGGEKITDVRVLKVLPPGSAIEHFSINDNVQFFHTEDGGYGRLGVWVDKDLEHYDPEDIIERYGNALFLRIIGGYSGTY